MSALGPKKTQNSKSILSELALAEHTILPQGPRPMDPGFSFYFLVADEKRGRASLLPSLHW